MKTHKKNLDAFEFSASISKSNLIINLNWLKNATLPGLSILELNLLSRIALVIDNFAIYLFLNLRFSKSSLCI